MDIAWRTTERGECETGATWSVYSRYESGWSCDAGGSETIEGVSGTLWEIYLLSVSCRVILMMSRSFISG